MATELIKRTETIPTARSFEPIKEGGDGIGDARSVRQAVDVPGEGMKKRVTFQKARL